MSQAKKSYWLLSETSSVEETRNPERQRHLPAQAAFQWLRAGWRDLTVQPALSLAYGAAVFVVTALLLWALFASGRDYILLPALAGYMIVAPLLAIGLYEKSRALENGERPTLQRMLFVRAQAGAQLFFTGVLLCLLMLLWMRAAVLLYALFFGVRPFPGFENTIGILFTTPIGWAMLVVGTLTGGLFAAFGFAISVFSIPMLLDQPDRRADRHGHEHGHGLEQSRSDARLGRHRPGPVHDQRRDGAHRLHRHLPAARARHLACLPGDALNGRGAAPARP